MNEELFEKRVPRFLFQFGIYQKPGLKTRSWKLFSSLFEKITDKETNLEIKPLEIYLREKIAFGF